MLRVSPVSVSPTPAAAFTDFTPVGPWTDGQQVTRNRDGVGFIYSAVLNAFYIIPNQSWYTKDANNLGIQNVPLPVNPQDAVNKAYVDAGLARVVPTYIQDTPPVGAPIGSLWWNSTIGQLFIYYSDGTSTQWVFAASSSAVQVIRSYLAGLTLSTAGSSATFSVAAGTCADSTNVDMMTLSSAISKTTAAWAVGTGVGGLDTGTIAAGWYHVYVIKRLDTNVTDVCFSLSAVAPTFGANIPSAYTTSRRIGSIKSTGTLWVLFRQLGDEFLWDSIVNDVSGLAISATPTRTTVTLASVPTGLQILAKFVVEGVTATGADRALNVIPFDVTQGGMNSIFISSAVDANSCDFTMRTNTSGQIQMTATSTGINATVWTYGWIDRRGRDA